MKRPEMPEIRAGKSTLDVDTAHDPGRITLSVEDNTDYGRDPGRIYQENLSIIPLDAAAMLKLRDHLSDILKYDRNMVAEREKDR